MNYIAYKLKNIVSKMPCNHVIVSFLKNYHFCLTLIYKTDKRSFIILFLINFLTLLLPIVNLFLAKALVDILVGLLMKTTKTVEDIMIVFFLYAVSSVILTFLTEYVQKLSIIQNQNLLSYINCELIKKSVDIDIEVFDIPKNYDELTKSRENAHSLHNIVFLTLTTITNVLSLATYFIFCVSHNIYLTLMVFIILIPSILFKIKYEKASYGFDKNQMRDIRKNQYRYSLMLGKTPAQEIRFFNLDKLFLSNFLSATKVLVDAKIHFSSRRKFINLLLNLPSNLFSVAIKIYATSRIFLKNSPIGDFIYIDGIFNRLGNIISDLSANISTFIGYNDKISDFKKYFDYKETEDDVGLLKLKAINEIKFDHVFFTYPNSDKLVLNDISFVIKGNEKVMLLGVNGSGKSTIIKLLTGFYKPQKGAILINGINMKELSLENYRQLQSLVFQDFNVYSFTIRENVGFGQMLQLKNTQKIQEALLLAKFSNVVFNKESDVDLYINKEFSEDGIVLSGGERQKIAISRAFFRDGDLLVLDEPTASLDPISENHILNLLKKLYNNKMAIIITHRLANAHSMDKIIVLDNGGISQIGTHKELYKTNLLYKSLYELQSSKYNTMDSNIF